MNDQTLERIIISSEEKSSWQTASCREKKRCQGACIATEIYPA